MYLAPASGKANPGGKSEKSMSIAKSKGETPKVDRMPRHRDRNTEHHRSARKHQTPRVTGNWICR
jgi:hypothetical protein